MEMINKAFNYPLLPVISEVGMKNSSTETLSGAYIIATYLSYL